LQVKRWTTGALIATSLLIGSIVGSYSPAFAGSDDRSFTYAGDYSAGSFPIGTFIALQYLGYSRSNTFITSSGRELPESHANIFYEFTRMTYFAQLLGQPLVLEAVVPFATLTDVNIPGTNNFVAGGLADPVLLLTYFFVADANIQRWFGFTSHFYLPLGRYDSQKVVNVSTADQFTYLPQVGYTEGLRKFAPALNGLFLDLIASASLHTDGNDPIDFLNPEGARFRGVLTYDTLSQKTSYDVKAFLRYEPKTFLFAAVGIEKSWGGEQTVSNGRFTVAGRPVVIPQPDLSISNDDFLRGHFQFQLSLGRDFLVAADVFHDFDRVGGFRNDAGVEVRLTKLFFPQTSNR
jgi:hypothetical protein